MKECIKQIIDIMKENNLISIQIDLVSNTVSEQYKMDSEVPVEEPVDDINQLVESIRQENPNAQQEDSEIVEEDIPEGYYDVSQVEMLTGFKRSGVYSLMQYYNVRVNKTNGRIYYNKEDVDNLVSKRNNTNSNVLTSDLANDLRITMVALRYRLRLLKIDKIRAGMKTYITKEDAEKIKESYKFNISDSDAYVDIDEVQKLLGLSPAGALKFVKRNHVTNTGRVARNKKSIILYNRYEIMSLLDQRDKQPSLGKYEISRDQFMKLLNCNASNAIQIARRHGLKVINRDDLKHRGKCVSIFDLRDMLKKLTSRKHASIIQRELERREAL